MYKDGHPRAINEQTHLEAPELSQDSSGGKRNRIPDTGAGIAFRGRGALRAKGAYDPTAKFGLDVPFPVVLDLHGGAWNAKNRTAEEPMDRAIASSGVLVVAI